jgi:hypothetical protein
MGFTAISFFLPSVYRFPRRLAPEQIHTLEAVFHVAEEREPGWASRIRFRPVMNAEDTANHILVDGNAKSQRDLQGDSRRYLVLAGRPVRPQRAFYCADVRRNSSK